VIGLVGQTQVRDLVYGARQELLLTVPDGSYWVDNSPDIAAAQRVAERGVSVRAYVSRTEGVPDLASSGLQVRTVAVRMPRMLVVDENIVVLARNQSDYTHGALITKDLTFAGMIVKWMNFEDDDWPRASEHIVRGKRDGVVRDVLHQLSSGATDTAAARAVGLTPRTYRRVVARLMTRLGARSRFQAGVLAAQRNWI
jgi:hypothetical protein